MPNELNMKLNRKCRWFGHKWNVAFISGKVSDRRLKFIGAYCSRCRKGYNELIKTVDNIETVYATYSEKYFNKDE